MSNFTHRAKDEAELFRTKMVNFLSSGSTNWLWSMLLSSEEKKEIFSFIIVLCGPRVITDLNIS